MRIAMQDVQTGLAKKKKKKEKIERELHRLFRVRENHEITVH